MSTEDKDKVEMTSSRQTEGDPLENKTGSSRSVADDLNLLASPFAYTPAPTDLVDLWDETDRFFDSLGDPSEFIEPEGEPTYNANLVKEALKTESNTPDQIGQDHTQSDREHRREELLRKRQEETSVKPKTIESSRPSLTERFIKRHDSETTLIVIAGGKGGSGRSLLAANLALSLDHLSHQSVGVVDLDPVGANLHTYLGLEPILEAPGMTLRGEVSPTCEKVARSNVVLTRSGRPLYGNFTEKERQNALDEALSLRPKWLIIDAGHVPDSFTLDLFTSADCSLIVYTPDPSSVERGHSFLQAALYRQLINQDDEASMIARSLLMADHEGVVAGPRTLARSLRHVHSAACRSLEQRINEFQPQIVVNQCRTQSDRSAGEMIASALKRKLSITPIALGAISFHHVAHQSLIERQPLHQLFPSASMSLDIDKITRSLMKADAQQTVSRERARRDVVKASQTAEV